MMEIKQHGGFTFGIIFKRHSEETGFKSGILKIKKMIQ